MNQEERDKILEEDDEILWNLPISMWRDDDNLAYPVVVMPRKEQCYNCSDEPMEESEVAKYCDQAIAAYGNAIELFRLFKEGKINRIYMFSAPQKYLEEMKKEREEDGKR